MSIYEKEKASYFDECMQSIIAQTVKPSEIVIVLDGPITPELHDTLNSYIEKNQIPIKVVRCEKNNGLGIALSKGIPECSNELIARMDTDDIARADRFEKQLELFSKHPELDICGSNIAEFEGSTDNIVCYRKVPTEHEDISKYQKTRSAFNHMTVMYKKHMVLLAGNYQDVPLMEDDSLWLRMLQKGAKCANIDENLVYARIDGGMIKRRGSWKYFLKYRKARKEMLRAGYINLGDYLSTVVIQAVVSLVPTGIRRLIFLRLLHR
ncbi:MAG: glycosyltransferase [Clostridia bacterium]|nr:glycosyltransferase [Clostridia bacterium]